MAETGKKSGPRYHRDEDRDTKKRATSVDVKDSEELVVYRILCPDKFIGSVIGKNGDVINSVRQGTGARVKVVNPFPGSEKRLITIWCYIKKKQILKADDIKQPLCAAQEALLKVHSIIANAVATALDDSDKEREIEQCEILVPSSQLAGIIGKLRATINKIKLMTKADIEIVAKDAGNPTHSCAMEFDHFVMISGEPTAVKEALFAISTIMYCSGPKEEIPLDTIMPEPSSIIMPSNVPIYSAHISPYADTGASFPAYSLYVPVVSGFGGKAQLTVKVLCPLDKIGRVIGKEGNSINRIRQLTGAVIEVDDVKGKGCECMITVISTESMDDVKSMAVEAVLLLEEKISDVGEKIIKLRFLVSSKVIGCIFGIGGSIVNEIQKKTKAEIRIFTGEKPRCADPVDDLVEVIGEVDRVREALVALMLKFRDNALKECEVSHDMSSGAVPLNSGGAVYLYSLVGAVPLNSAGAVPLYSAGVVPLYSGGVVPLGEVPLYSDGAVPLYADGAVPLYPDGAVPLYPDGAVPLYPDGAVLLYPDGAPLYSDGSVPLYSDGAAPLYSDGSVPLYSDGVIPLYFDGVGFSMPSVMPNIQSMAPMHYEQPMHYEPRKESSCAHEYRFTSIYGDAHGASLSSYSSKRYGGIDSRFPAPSTLEMVIPGHAVNNVMGKDNSNLANICQISGAAIEVIPDSRSTRGDMIARISGTFDQKRAAENLIQAFIMAA